ncbi:hypothetical protein BC936DRAFT_139322 [Jimgerdemannia flammicorona]|uniref:Uncharacterized protein n=1 Tax=Jimgerdemannia flammicorona TaxID=994334 RepID=A0A433DMR2_9FUNG|nr:hypothetical protein BC936DRAFT_139322 [Jimgerdemannia flammicorona]
MQSLARHPTESTELKFTQLPAAGAAQPPAQSVAPGPGRGNGNDIPQGKVSQGSDSQAAFTTSTRPAHEVADALKSTVANMLRAADQFQSAAQEFKNAVDLLLNNGDIQQQRGLSQLQQQHGSLRQQQTSLPQVRLRDEGVPLEDERRRLSELKAVASRHAIQEGVPLRRGEAAVAQSAESKYAAALALEHNTPIGQEQRSVPPADYYVDEQRLAEELRDEAAHRMQAERVEVGRIPRAGPAAKVQAAATRIGKLAAGKIGQPGQHVMEEQQGTE